MMGGCCCVGCCLGFGMSAPQQHSLLPYPELSLPEVWYQRERPVDVMLYIDPPISVNVPLSLQLQYADGTPLDQQLVSWETPLSHPQNVFVNSRLNSAYFKIRINELSYNHHQRQFRILIEAASLPEGVNLNPYHFGPIKSVSRRSKGKNEDVLEAVVGPEFVVESQPQEEPVANPSPTSPKRRRTEDIPYPDAPFLEDDTYETQMFYEMSWIQNSVNDLMHRWHQLRLREALRHFQR